MTKYFKKKCCVRAHKVHFGVNMTYFAITEIAFFK